MSTCTAGGAHHWRLGEVDGAAYVSGTCKKCQLTRDDFPASSTLDWLNRPDPTPGRIGAEVAAARRRRYKQRDITLSPSRRGTYVGAAES